VTGDLGITVHTTRTLRGGLIKIMAERVKKT
jgi:hypothetical protein